jgi:small subunit ribosomal protein S17e
VDRIKRLSYEVLDEHKSKFGEDFVINKKALDEVSIVRSKGLKNEIAGYITKFIKKEVREGKAKQARIDASKAEQQMAEKSETETTVDSVVEEETEIVEVPETVEATPEEVPSDTAKETTE